MKRKLLRVLAALAALVLILIAANPASADTGSWVKKTGNPITTGWHCSGSFTYGGTGIRVYPCIINQDGSGSWQGAVVWEGGADVWLGAFVIFKTYRNGILKSYISCPARQINPAEWWVCFGVTTNGDLGAYVQTQVYAFGNYPDSEVYPSGWNSPTRLVGG